MVLVLAAAVPVLAATTPQGKQRMYQSPFMLQMTQKYPAMQKMLGANPKMLEMMQLPAMQTIMQGQQMQQLMKDPEIQKAMQSGDMMQMITNPKMQEVHQSPEHQQVMNDPQVKEFMQKNGMGDMTNMTKDPNHRKDANHTGSGMMGKGSGVQ